MSNSKFFIVGKGNNAYPVKSELKVHVNASLTSAVTREHLDLTLDNVVDLTIEVKKEEGVNLNLAPHIVIPPFPTRAGPPNPNPVRHPGRDVTVPYVITYSSDCPPDCICRN